MARDEKTVLLQMIGNQAIQIAQQQVTIEAQQTEIETLKPPVAKKPDKAT